MKNYYEEIIKKISCCVNDIYTTKKHKLDKLKDILYVSYSLYETGRLTTAQFDTILIIITEHMWECL